MRTDDFDYNLPKELIAQTPLKERSGSRMLALNKQTGEYTDKNFTDLIDYLNPGDTLVLNDTKVIPARIIGVDINKVFFYSYYLSDDKVYNYNF